MLIKCSYTFSKKDFLPKDILDIFTPLYLKRRMLENMREINLPIQYFTEGDTLTAVLRVVGVADVLEIEGRYECGSCRAPVYKNERFCTNCGEELRWDL